VIHLKIKASPFPVRNPSGLTEVVKVLGSGSIGNMIQSRLILDLLAFLKASSLCLSLFTLNNPSSNILLVHFHFPEAEIRLRLQWGEAVYLCVFSNVRSAIASSMVLVKVLQ